MGASAASVRGSKHILLGAAMIVAVGLMASCGSQATTSAGSEAGSGTPSTTSAAPVTTGRPGRVQPSKTQGGRLGVPTDTRPPDVTVHHAPLTTQNWATYDFTTQGASVTASAPAGLTDFNVREVFWRTDERPSVDQQSCITWQETAGSVAGSPIQPGLAMRIASVGAHNSALRAVTVTENVVFAGVWLFNVHVWDTSNPVPMTLLKTFDASPVVGRISNVDGHVANMMVEPPWHLCGRTWGRIFSFKVWTRNDPEPAWNDPDHVFSLVLPKGWDYSGYSGGYIGHLHNGQSATASTEPSLPAGG